VRAIGIVVAMCMENMYRYIAAEGYEIIVTAA
jgi:hypothetical protein